MSIESSTTQEPSQQQKLRIELKEWEKGFAAANGGRKAGREDIKKEPEIAAKYKAYNKLRANAIPKDPFAPQQSSSAPPPSKARKVQEGGTPRKPHSFSSKTKHGEIQSSQHHASTLDPCDQPSAHSTPSSVRTRRVVGPTPQKNGQVLGLFDLLSPASAKKNHPNESTPSRKAPLETTIANTTVNPSTTFNEYVHTAGSQDLLEAKPIATPSKPRVATLPNISEGHDLTVTPAPRRLGRTPQSSGKRKFLDAFLTPSTRRTHTLSNYVRGIGEHNTTPSSRGKQGTASILAESDALAASLLAPAPSEPTTAPDGLDVTPIFLRRFTAPVTRPLNDASGAESLLGTDIPAVRLPRRKPFGRSLSEMVRSLREEREKQMDEEEAIMREMELEAESGVGPPKRPKILVRDSQSGGAAFATQAGGELEGRREEREMRLGADGEWSSEDDDDDGAEGKREEEKRKKWKKKGQKRTTRKAKIKPGTGTWVPEKEWAGGEDEDEDGDGDAGEEAQEGETVGETQPAGNDERGEEDAEYDDAGQAKQPPAKAKRGRPNSKTAKEGDGKEKDKATAKKPRKVNAAAHANFRALKIKNKGSKGRGGRFGRRR